MVSDDIIAFKNPKSVSAESYRALRTNLEFSMASEYHKTILVTSSHVSEGKSSIVSNLATVFAMQDKKVVIVDADMRRGVQHKKFNISNKNGLSSFLAKMTKYDDLVKRTEIPNLFVCTAGPVPPNPAELLSTQTMKDLLETLKKSFDIVIIDGAPVLPVTDSVILSSVCDKVIIVAAYGETHKEELKAVKQSLTNAGANIAGVVLNKVDMRGAGYAKYGKYGKGYYGAYTYYGDNKENS